MTPAAPAAPTRLRVRYSKTGKVRFTSHRDVVRMWERAIRRSGIPVAWSEGYSPHLLLSFGHALPTGAESLAEYLDLTLAAGVSGPEPWAAADATRAPLTEQLSALLPDGVDVQAIAAPPHGSWSLQQEVSSCSWNLEVFGLAAEELASRVERLLAAPTALVERERKGRTAPDDLRPAVLALAVVNRSGPEPVLPVAREERARLEAELATRPRGVRPRELLEVLGPGVRLSRACRTQQWIERDGIRVEPLTADGREAGTVAAHADRRAS
ncbi:MAG TPA: TIGR03936 family radical SAM-associated protein [Acidimicrobiales bacterium]|nr:TIGR03936 family radical SAM-associated protein [Acidimicrobiales bacterium]